jgi:hypothetical protein
MSGPLYVSHLADIDRLDAVEFGRLADGQPAECWRAVSDPHAPDDDGPLLGYLHDGALGRPVGFSVLGLSVYDVDRPGVAEIWGPPYFDVPQLGLDAVSAGEIVLAARAGFDDYLSVGRDLCLRAEETTGAAALASWLSALDAGELGAHLGAGRALFDLGLYGHAYTHLRWYALHASASASAWCWLGRAAEALDNVEEAMTAYERAVVLEEPGVEETRAAALLAGLEARRPRVRRRWRRG